MNNKMKKFMKICALVALVMIIVGVSMAVAAGSVAGTQSISEVVDSATNGKLQVKLESLTDWGITVSDKIVEELGGFNVNVNYDIDENTMFESDYEIIKGDKEKYCPGENITNLDIEVGGCNFETRVSGDDKIYIAVENAYKFQSFVEKDTLYIKGTIGTATWNELSDFKVILYLPEKYEFETIDLEVGAGLVRLGQLSADEVEMEVGAGVVSLESISAPDAKIKVGAGQIEITHIDIDDLDIEVGMGECVVAGSVNNSANVECAMGNVELKLDGKEEDFNYKLEGAMGNIALGDNSFSGFANERTISNGAEKNMNVECAMGNITISFME